MKTTAGIAGAAGAVIAQFIIGGCAAIGHPLGTSSQTLLTQAAIGVAGLALLAYTKFQHDKKTGQQQTTISSLVETNTTLSNQIAVTSLNIPKGAK